MSQVRKTILAELGIPCWKPRPGVVFPGGPVQEGRATSAPLLAPCTATALDDGVPASAEPAVDILLQAEARTAEERALFANILKAVQGLRQGLRVMSADLDHAPVQGVISVRLDGINLPSLAELIADPGRKRPLWQALKDAVARLP